ISTSGSSTVTSGTFAPVKLVASGTPPPSVTTWSFVVRRPAAIRRVWAAAFRTDWRGITDWLDGPLRGLFGGVRTAGLGDQSVPARRRPRHGGREDRAHCGLAQTRPQSPCRRPGPRRDDDRRTGPVHP